MDGHRRYLINKEKKRRRKGWICSITYITIHLIITGYLVQNLNLFLQILLVIVSITLMFIVYYYLIHKIFFKKKKTRISFDNRY